jgi:adenylate kinase
MDGFPRTIVQAKAFENGIDKVVYLKVSDKEALWRLSGRDDNREDDTLKAIRKRISLFHEFTEPVIDYYRQKEILVELDGEKSIEEISKEILSELDK